MVQFFLSIKRGPQKVVITSRLPDSILSKNTVITGVQNAVTSNLPAIILPAHRCTELFARRAGQDAITFRGA